MNRRRLLIALIVVVIAARAAFARLDERMPVVGTLTITLTNNPLLDAFHEGMRELGYIEGRNVKLEERGAEGHIDQLPELAKELAQRKVDVIVAFNTSAARAAAAASTGPIVFVAADPVASGLAANLAKPGGNATGISLIATELASKRLEMLRLLVPGARRMAFLSDSTKSPGMQQLQEVQNAARMLGVQLVDLNISDPDQLDRALTNLKRRGVQALIIGNDPLLYVNRGKVAVALQRSKIPAVFPYRAAHESGVLMSYGVDFGVAGRKVAWYVDKILKGAKPGELPVEEISKYELIIDLRVAHELGLKMPQELLQRADKVIR